ncbi:hypothetical protein PP707_04180, partial [Acetobacter pasteurianus]|nr:hypothetical protein [Acetobacter pasteurianus]
MNTSSNNIASTTSTTTAKYNFLPKFNHQHPHRSLRHLSARSNVSNGANAVPSNAQSQPQPQQHQPSLSRHASSEIIDSLANTLPYNRTVSSSSSILSTPSNNIRTYRRRQEQQQQQQQQQQQTYTSEQKHTQTHAQPHKHGESKNSSLDPNDCKLRSGQLIRNKLLNIHQTTRQQLKPDPIPSLPPDNDSDAAVLLLPQPQLQQNQKHKLKLQHSSKPVKPDAAYYCQTLIFGDNLSSDDEEEEEEKEEKEKDNDDHHYEDQRKYISQKNIVYNKGALGDVGAPLQSIIKSIPGYTKGELNAVLKHVSTQNSFFLNDDEQKRVLNEYKRHQLKLERVSYNYKYGSNVHVQRRLQADDQKRDVLHKLFGYSNKINVEYMAPTATNSDESKVKIEHLHHNEDHLDHVGHLDEEESLFTMSLQNVRGQMQSDPSSSTQPTSLPSSTSLSSSLASPPLLNKRDFDGGLSMFQEVNANSTLDEETNERIAKFGEFKQGLAGTSYRFLTEEDKNELVQLGLQNLRNCIKLDKDAIYGDINGDNDDRERNEGV